MSQPAGQPAGAALLAAAAAPPGASQPHPIARPSHPDHTTPGFFTGAALLLIPVPGQRRRGGSCRWLMLQALCAALVICGAAAGAVGVALHADLGSKSSFLEDGSCVDFGVWKCLPAGASPNGCFVEAHPDGSGPATLYCPSVRTPWFRWLGSVDSVGLQPAAGWPCALHEPAGPHIQPPTTTSLPTLQGEGVPLKNIQVPAGDTDALTAVCYQQCTSGASAAASPSPAPSAPPSPPPRNGGSGGSASTPAAGGSTADSSTGGGSSAGSSPSTPSSEPGGGGELFVRRRR